MVPTITAYDWVPRFARGHVRDLRVRWALEEAGRDYAVRYLPQGAQKRPAHREEQPFGQVPTYEEGDLALFESGAIVLHVADGCPALLPPAPAARARAIGWMFAALNTVEPPVTDYVIATLFERDEPWTAARLPSARNRLNERLDELARHLGEAAWLDGDRFTAGDLLMADVLRTADGLGLLVGRETLAGYVARAEARPAFGRALRAQLAGFTGAPPPPSVQGDAA